jgi:hypothetical protein
MSLEWQLKGKWQDSSLVTGTARQAAGPLDPACRRD